MNRDPTEKSDVTESRVQCPFCKHLIEWPYCLAFLSGEGIPEDIRLGQFDHTLPHPGDHGITFTASDSPYDLSEAALKELMTQYRGETIMPALPEPQVPEFIERSELEPGTAEQLVEDIDEQPTPQFEEPPTAQLEQPPTPQPEEPPAEQLEQPSAEQTLEQQAEPDLETHEEPSLEAQLEAELEAQLAAIMGGADLSTPLDLIEASRQGNLEKVRHVLDSGADIDSQDSEGYTALMYACRNCYPEIVRLLLSRGSGVDTKNNYDKTALDIAEDWGYPSIVELLKAFGAKESEPSIF